MTLPEYTKQVPGKRSASLVAAQETHTSLS
jgi:hypothetical protein